MLVNFKIFETEGFRQDIEDLPSHTGLQLREKLTHYVYPQLRQSPYFGKNIKKLRDCKPATWRYRVGDYRLFYEINKDGSVVIMLTVSARKDAY